MLPFLKTHGISIVALALAIVALALSIAKNSGKTPTNLSSTHTNQQVIKQAVEDEVKQDPTLLRGTSMGEMMTPVQAKMYTNLPVEECTNMQAKEKRTMEKFRKCRREKNVLVCPSDSIPHIYHSFNMENKDKSQRPCIIKGILNKTPLMKNMKRDPNHWDYLGKQFHDKNLR